MHLPSGCGKDDSSSLSCLGLGFTVFWGFGVWGFRLRTQGSGVSVQGPGFSVDGSGFRVQVSGFRIEVFL